MMLLKNMFMVLFFFNNQKVHEFNFNNYYSNNMYSYPRDGVFNHEFCKSLGIVTEGMMILMFYFIFFLLLFLKVVITIH